VSYNFSLSLGKIPEFELGYCKLQLSKISARVRKDSPARDIIMTHRSTGINTKQTLISMKISLSYSAIKRYRDQNKRV